MPSDPWSREAMIGRLFGGTRESAILENTEPHPGDALDSGADAPEEDTARGPASAGGQEGLLAALLDAREKAQGQAGGGSDPGSPQDVWEFFLAPVVEDIRTRTERNPLLPIFIVENPYPRQEERFVQALEKSLPDYHALSLTETNSAALARLMVKSALRKQLKLILVCTSRKSLPHEFYSLVRHDGYLGIPRLTPERLSEYARARGFVAPSGDMAWVQWIGPQELLFANALAPEQWGAGLEQLAMQRFGDPASGGRVRTLDELYGVEQAKSWARQLSSDIRLATTPGSGVGWDDVDQGALLVGAPGTGKTTLAQAIARECGTNFIFIKPSVDWMSGDGLDECVKLMAATFATARQQDPCIIFIDEIDSIGNRENFHGHNASWNTSFLNALLSEMDGFPGDQVIVIAATNYPENVDAALKRAGRLDRVINLPRPDPQALQAMLQGKLHPYLHAIGDADFDDLARMCFGLTGADIDVLVRGARRRARLDGNRAVTRQDLFQEIYNIPLSAERKPLSGQELERCAFHEAGHALVALKLGTLRSHLRIASIIPDEAGSLGFVGMNAAGENETRRSLLDRLCMALAGRAAEALQYGDCRVSTGAGGSSDSSDLALARRIAEAYLGRYGFSDEAPNWYTDAPDPAEAKALVAAQYARACALLQEHSGQWQAVAARLLERHVLDRADLISVVPESASDDGSGASAGSDAQRVGP